MDHAEPGAVGPGKIEPAAVKPGAVEMDEAEAEALRNRAVAALRTCYDPEIPVNVYDLGMVYHIGVVPGPGLAVTMTLTSPNCPAIETLPAEAELKLRSIPGVSAAKVTIVWDPPWSQERMSEAAQLQLGLL
jgi:FeS assembly SUF system protein